MAGHSKWANIKHKKAKTDAIKGKVYTKLSREILVAAKAGGPDPNANFRLKIAIENAKAENLPNENIQRAIQKGAGGGEGANVEELRYEGYGLGGVAIMVDIMTDNRNRTAPEMRYIFSKNGGNLGETGSVNWMFQEKGLLVVPRDNLEISEDDFMLLALEAGAEDIEAQDDTYDIFTIPDDLIEVRHKLLEQKIPIENAAVQLFPINKVEIADLEQARKNIKLMEMLEAHDDVQNVYTNFELADSLANEDF